MSGIPHPLAKSDSRQVQMKFPTTPYFVQCESSAKLRSNEGSDAVAKSNTFVTMPPTHAYMHLNGCGNKPLHADQVLCRGVASVSG
jgi:hypothetical protein